MRSQPDLTLKRRVREKLRLLAPEKLGHEFMLSPVPEALEWLDAMVDWNPGKAASYEAHYAVKWLREE